MSGLPSVDFFYGRKLNPQTPPVFQWGTGKLVPGLWLHIPPVPPTSIAKISTQIEFKEWIIKKNHLIKSGFIYQLAPWYSSGVADLDERVFRWEKTFFSALEEALMFHPSWHGLKRWRNLRGLQWILSWRRKHLKILQLDKRILLFSVGKMALNWDKSQRGARRISWPNVQGTKELQSRGSSESGHGHGNKE